MHMLYGSYGTLNIPAGKCVNKFEMYISNLIAKVVDLNMALKFHGKIF